MLRLNDKLNEVQLLPAYERLFIPLPHFICERKFYARTHVKINQPPRMPRNEKAGPKRPYKPPLPQTCLGYPALMTLNLLRYNVSLHACNIKLRWKDAHL